LSKTFDRKREQKMRTAKELQIAEPAASSAVDRSCAYAKGCGGDAMAHVSNAAAITGKPAAKSGIKAAIVGVLCVLGCLAGPLLIGGFAAVGSAVAGEVWILAIGVVAAIIIGVVLKKRGKGSIC
jgi:hypothetical protein